MNTRWLLFLLILMFQVCGNAYEYLLLPERTYIQLDLTARAQYIKSLQKIYHDLEVAISTHPAQASSFLQYLMLQTATAANVWNDQCLVGGIIRKTSGGKCPTQGRPCGEGDNYRCGVIFGGSCISRTPVETLSDRCLNTARPVNLETYHGVKAEYEAMIDTVCSSPPPQGEKPCKDAKSKIAEINASMKDRVPPPKPEPPLPPPQNTGFQVDKANACTKDRDQGQNGTCHAFCLTCVYDQALAKKTNKPSKVSANWISMLSVVDRVCDNTYNPELNSSQLMRQGWYPERNMQMLAAYGACQESSFLPYSDTSNFKQTRSLLKYPPVNNSPDWAQHFGISGPDVAELFCPREDRNALQQRDPERFRARLEQMRIDGKINSKFYQCARESLDNAKKLTPDGASATCGRTPFSANNSTESIVEGMKAVLRKENRPMPLVISTDREGHALHCVTITGWDDKKQEFTTINSWGTNTAYTSIPFSQVKTTMLGFTRPSCMEGFEGAERKTLSGYSNGNGSTGSSSGSSSSGSSSSRSVNGTR